MALSLSTIAIPPSTITRSPCPRCPDPPVHDRAQRALGGAAQAHQCAQALGVKATTYRWEHGREQAGYFEFDGVHIDFVPSPRGVAVRDLDQLSVPFPSVRVMHPIHVLESRAANVVELNRTTPLALKQLRVSIVVMREFLRELLDAEMAPREVTKLCTRVFDFSKSPSGLAALERHRLDVFEAVIHDDERLPEGYRTQRYPRMKDELAAVRAKRKAPSR